MQDGDTYWELTFVRTVLRMDTDRDITDKTKYAFSLLHFNFVKREQQKDQISTSSVFRST